MVEFTPYEKRYKYPHMAPLDVAIWERFITANPDIFDVVSYDVPVGDGASFDTVVNPETGGDVGKLYQRKIDVVGRKNGIFFVVEVKPRASTSAIGQVKGYVTLFKRDYTIHESVVPIIVTDELLPEMEFLAKGEGVQIILA